MAKPVNWGSQFLINTTTKKSQHDASLHGLKDGSFVAVWTDESETGADMDGQAVRGQILNADGTKRGGEFLINTTVQNSQMDPKVAVLNDGRFVVTWLDRYDVDFVKARAFTANGTPIGNEFQVNARDVSSSAEPTITALSDGGFAVAFKASDDIVYAQSFNSSLGPVGGEVQISTDQNWSYQHVMAGLQGRYGVFFVDRDGTDAIRGRFLNNDGTAPSDLSAFVTERAVDRISSATATTLADGRTVLVWNDRIRSLDAKGDDIWTSALKAQILNANGTKSGGAITLKSVTSDIGSLGMPEIAASRDGGFAVSYVYRAYGENTSEIRLASYNSGGISNGADLAVERNVLFEEGSMAITPLADGRMSVAWDAYLSPWDNKGYGIHSQIVDPRHKGVNLSGTSAKEHYVGSRFRDKLDGKAGNDKLAGGLGKDILKGGSGRDVFVFDTKASKKNIDKIQDFNGRADKIYLDNLVFKGLGKKGSATKPSKLKKDAFWVGSKAHDKEDRIIFNKEKGALLYDPDGAGKAAAVQIASLTKNLKNLDAGDFFVI